MAFWTPIVDVTYALLFALAGAFGGNIAVAIAVLSALVRLALLPLTLRLAYRSMEMQAKMKQIEPALTAIRKRYKDDPRRLLEETAKLHREHDIKLADGWTFFGLAAQAPIFFALLGAIRRGVVKASRFLWIRDLARPDGVLLVITSAVIALSSVLAPNATHRPLIFIVTAAITILLMSKVAAGMMIYTLTSSGVGMVQTVMMRRRARRG